MNDESGLPDFVPIGGTDQLPPEIEEGLRIAADRLGGVTLQEIVDKSLAVLMEELETPLPSISDPTYLLARKQRLTAVEAGLRTAGRVQDNLLRQKQGEDMKTLLARIADAEIKGRLLLADPT